MSGPGRATTKRDRRRMTRREQYDQRRQERERERQRKLRNQRIQRYSLYGAGGVAAIVIIVLLSVFVFHIGSGSNNTPKKTNPAAVATFPPVSVAAANAQTIDGMACAATPGSVQNLHAYLEIYINGQQMTVPTGIGAPPGKNCSYPLVTPNGEPNVIHVASASTSAYTLGQFFDVWGQSLSTTQVGKYKADSSHKLVFEVFDASGKLTTITSDPTKITLVNHETLVILYNSPNVHPKAFTGWSSLKS